MYCASSEAVWPFRQVNEAYRNTLASRNLNKKLLLVFMLPHN